MAALAFELLLRFLWGSMLILVFVSRKETSERFLRIASWILVSCAGIAAIFLWKAVESAKIPTGIGTQLSHAPLASIEQGGLSLLFLVTGALLYSRTFLRSTRTLGFFLFLVSPAWIFYQSPAVHAFNFVSGSLLMGAVFAGQYLGHWYLTVPGMHIQELRRVINLLFAAVVIKTIEITIGLSIWSQQVSSTVDTMGRPVGLNLTETSSLTQLNLSHGDFGVSGSLWLGFGTFGVILFIARILWGLLAPIVLGYMVQKTVDMRSTQSATGILYALCVAVLFGEGTALYLKYTLGIFL